MPDPDPSFLKQLFLNLKYKLKSLKPSDKEANLRATLEGLIEKSHESELSLESDERTILGNVLSLRDLTVEDVMIPRADIVAVPQTISAADLMETMIHSHHSRLPVYRDTLDDVIGIVQIKDCLAWKASNNPYNIKTLVREVLYISPTMRTLDLLLQMRESGKKMALVVDEYGGIDGLVTFSDLIEEIIGDIQDAQERGASHQIFERPDGTLVLDGRLELETIEEKLGLDLMTPELEDDIDTVGGLVASLVGRVPTRGELIIHPSGLEFEVLDADPRRVKSVCLRGWISTKKL